MTCASECANLALKLRPQTPGRRSGTSGRPHLLLTSGCADLSDAAAAVHQERHDGTDQEYHEQDLGDPGCAYRDSAKAEHGSNERNDKKNDCVMKHGIPL